MPRERSRAPLPKVGELAEALRPFSPGAAHLVERIRLAAATQPAAGSDPALAVQTSTLPLAPPPPEPADKGTNTVTDGAWTNARAPSEAPKARRVAGGVGATLALALVLASAGAWYARSRSEVRAPSTAASRDTRVATSEPLPSPHVSPPPAAPIPTPTELAVSAAASAGKPPQAELPVQPKSLPPGTSAPKTQRSKSAVWNQRD